jgi:thymidylate synthase (FAD)
MKTAPISVTLIDSCGSDLSTVNAARVSFHKESDWARNWAGDADGLTERDEKLINYLAKHEHLSPFNHAFLSFRVKAPIFVARQLVKHKFLPWNEVSRRYVDEEPEFYFPDKWRARAADKKQGSSSEEVAKLHIFDLQFEDIKRTSERVLDYPLELYNRMVEQGVAPEQARMVLPQNTMTEWIWSGTLGAFCAMLKLRLKEDTQEETREVASLISKEVQRLFPVSFGALVNE